MRKILVIILILNSFIGYGQSSKLSEIIHFQNLSFEGSGEKCYWISDTPLQLPGTSSISNDIPKFEVIDFCFGFPSTGSDYSEVMLIGELQQNENTREKNNGAYGYTNKIIAYPTFGDFKIFVAKNMGEINEEGLIIITVHGIGDPNYPHSPSVVDEGK